MKSCEGLCNGPVNVIGGMKAQIIDDFTLGRGLIVPGQRDCPFGFKHNPVTKVKTRNLIKNGGIHTICQKNKWKREVFQGKKQEQIKSAK